MELVDDWEDVEAVDETEDKEDLQQELDEFFCPLASRFRPIVFLNSLITWSSQLLDSRGSSHRRLGCGDWWLWFRDFDRGVTESQTEVPPLSGIVDASLIAAKGPPGTLLVVVVGVAE